MISFDTDSHRFHLRAAAIIVRRESILLHRLESDDFWSLPGGRVEPGEAGAEAVIRELREELGIVARAKDLSLLVENFFTHSDVFHHEVGLYFNVEVEEHALPTDEAGFSGSETFKKLFFRWFPISTIDALDVRPSVLKAHLMRGAVAFKHVVHRADTALDKPVVAADSILIGKLDWLQTA